MNKIVLSSFLVFLLALTHVQATSMDETMMAVKHAHPLPNLMRVIQQHKNELNLSVEQKQELESWIKEHRAKLQELALSIRDGEKALAEVALNGAPKTDILVQLDELLKKRREMASIKIDCRDNMRQLLGEDKWKQVVALYKGM